MSFLKKKNVFIVFGGVALVAVVGFGLISLFPQVHSWITNDVTSDWNEYRSEKYGFKIKYPQEYTIKEYNEHTDFYSNLALLEHEENKISLRIIENKDIYENRLPEEVLGLEVNSSPCTVAIVDFMVRDYNAAQASLSGTCSGEIVLIGHPSQNLFVQLRFNPGNIDKDKILSTFRFIKST